MKRRWLIGAALAGSIAGGALVKKLWLAKYREQAAALAEAARERDLTYTWLLLKEKSVKLTEYFEARGQKTVAILGMNRLGRLFYDELRDCEGVNAAYGVEADLLGAVHETMTVYRLGDDPLPPADCMVVCGLERVPERVELARQEFPGAVVTLTQVLAELLARREIEPRDGAVPDWPPAE